MDTALRITIYFFLFTVALCIATPFLIALSEMLFAIFTFSTGLLSGMALLGVRIFRWIKSILYPSQQPRTQFES